MMKQPIAQAKYALAVAASLAAAGCSVSSHVSAVSVRTDNGAVVADEWKAETRCGVGTGAPCSADAQQRRTRFP